MQTEIISLREVLTHVPVYARLKPAGVEAIMNQFEGLVKVAALDPNEISRQRYARRLNDFLKNSVHRIFGDDGQLFMVLENEENRGVVYVCEMPKIYEGEPSHAYGVVLERDSTS